jgi:hypothetical protein
VNLLTELLPELIFIMTPSFFRHSIALLIIALSFARVASAVPKPHLITFGKWVSVTWFPNGNTNEKPLPLKVRPLLIDTRVREFTLGPAHDITERLFVVRRAFRVNDSLPQESETMPHWQWQRGGWLLVDRVSGRVTAIALPEFDAFYSGASWYRDYVAYCGVSEDGKKVFAIVAQISRRKPVLKKALDGAVLPESDDPAPDTACPAPAWQRAPARVTFELVGGGKQTFAIRGHIADVLTEDEDDEEASR